ncbi:hypothetical protein R3X25_08360 [Lutibacter sp. TH_r2]|uniref:hypothetical protein n=1 Tax=Lutibacter sp. TH_r2 TaxID=3082083 RepID=UPI0029536783|nr:hypothetical protein [Lutibacter sp. TH_r2]MDV7187289.1 hypothetical protein [Lutibacter sp. TH_r2]
MKFIITLFLFINIQSFASPILDQIRSKFPLIENKEEAENFIQKLENRKDVSSQGYLAAMYFFKSKYVKFPTTKYKYFKKGKNLLDLLIKKNPNVVELHYIRFIFQHQIPSFLNYNEDKIEDFKAIYKADFIKNRELKILLKLDKLSISHKQKINELLNQ